MRIFINPSAQSYKYYAYFCQLRDLVSCSRKSGVMFRMASWFFEIGKYDLLKVDLWHNI